MADPAPAADAADRLRPDHDRAPAAPLATPEPEPDVLARAVAHAERVARSIAGGRTLAPGTITITVSLPSGLSFAVTEPVTRPEPVARAVTV